MLAKGVRLGSYSVLSHISSSSRGDTYLAENRRSQQQVVLKIFNKEMAFSTEDTARDETDLFMRQARELSQLNHPGILSLLDYGEVLLEKATHLYLVTRFCPDGSLAQWIEQYQPSLSELTLVVSQIANALQYAHEHGIIHQNVKPSNILLDGHSEKLERLNEANILLTDFMPDTLAYETISLTLAHDKHATAYCAPEQLAGKSVFATDQYALAIVAYQLLSGHLPSMNKDEKGAGDAEQEASQDLEVPTLPQDNSNLHIPTELGSVLLRALSQNPENRYSSITAFAQAFKEAIESTPTVAPAVDDEKKDLNQLSTEISTVEKSEIEAITEPDSEGQSNRGNDIYVQIPIGRADARRGTTCKVTLPGGRIVTVPIPPHTRNGQVIRLTNQGEVPPGGGVPGALIITVITSSMLDSNTLIRAVNNLQRTRITVLAVIAILVILDAIALLIIGNVTQANAINHAYADITATARIHNLIAAAIGGSATAQAEAVNARYPFSNTVGLDDPLTNATKGYGWSVGTDCQFTNNAYHVITPSPNSYDYCIASNKAFGDFTFQVQMVISKGNCGGMIFRENNSNQQAYFFMLCQDGSYSLSVEQGSSSFSSFKLLANHSSPVINKGVGQSNLIAVVARGNTINLYANNQLLDSLQDSTYSLGQVALLAFPHSLSPLSQHQQTEVIYSNAKAWILGTSS